MLSKANKQEIYPVFIPHAGCPHRCVFCDQERTSSTVGLPEIEQLRCWLDDVLPESGVGQVAFYGGTFTALSRKQQTSYLKLVETFIEQGRIAAVRVSTRPDRLSAVVLDKLSAHGVRTIEVGCQSFNDRVLELSGRGHNAAQAADAVRACKAAGFEVGVQLMPGLPGAGTDEALTSLCSALELVPDFIRIYPTVVVKDTVLAEQWRSGDYVAWSLEAAVECVADMMCRSHEAGVPVIRTGLQHAPELVESILDGPYHPAFGQLVRSRLWRRAVKAAVEQGANNLLVHPSDLSDVYGHSRDNLKWFEAMDYTRSILPNSEVPRGYLCADGSVSPALPMMTGGMH